MDLELIFGSIIILWMWLMGVISMIGGPYYYFKNKKVDKNEEGTVVVAKCIEVKTKRRYTRYTWHTEYNPVWEYEFEGKKRKYEDWYYGKKWFKGDTTSFRVDSKGNILFEDTPEGKNAGENSNFFMGIIGTIMTVILTPLVIGMIRVFLGI